MSGLSNLNGLLQGIGTVTAFIAFIGICVWAYSGKRKSGFDAAALLPFQEDADLFSRPAGDRAGTDATHSGAIESNNGKREQ